MLRRTAVRSDESGAGLIVVPNRSSAAGSPIRSRVSESASSMLGPILVAYRMPAAKPQTGPPSSNLWYVVICPIYWDPSTVPELFTITLAKTICTRWRPYPKIIWEMLQTVRSIPKSRTSKSSMVAQTQRSSSKLNMLVSSAQSLALLC